jgi:hypothetical protein
MEDGPITWPPKAPGSGFIHRPQDVYHDAQQVDEWPGDNYAGTSVRAGAKILQRLGVIQDYRWAFTVANVANAILYVGPVVVGTRWYDGMFSPDSRGFIKPTGSVAGGHAYVLNGVNTTWDGGFFRIKNSWGRNWGENGYARIRFDHFSDLMTQGGEVCLATETKP